MSEETGQEPQTIEELIASIRRQFSSVPNDVPALTAALAQIAVLLIQDTLAPPLRGLAQELQDTRAVLKEASDASTKYASALVFATWALVAVTAVLVLATVAPLIWGKG